MKGESWPAWLEKAGAIRQTRLAMQKYKAVRQTRLAMQK